MMLNRHMNAEQREPEMEGLSKQKAVPLDEWLNMPPRKPYRKVMVQSGTRNIYKYMIASVKSYLANSDVDHIFLLVEDEIFPMEIPDCITCIDVREQKYFPADGPNMRSKFTYMALLRSMLCYLFPEYDKLVCVDFDTIALTDVSGLWELPLGDNYYSASKERTMSKNTGLYYTNIGVCLYNLKALRDGTADAIRDELNRKAYDFVEQDVLIRKCQGRIQPMDSVWNSCPYVEPPQGEVRIEHYAGRKQWEIRRGYQLYDSMPWREVMDKHQSYLDKRI